MGHYARVGPVRGVDFGSYDSRDERGAFHLSFVSRSRLLVLGLPGFLCGGCVCPSLVLGWFFGLFFCCFGLTRALILPHKWRRQNELFTHGVRLKRKMAGQVARASHVTGPKAFHGMACSSFVTILSGRNKPSPSAWERNGKKVY